MPQDARDAEGAGKWAQLAEHGAQQRRLAAAVGTEQRKALPGLEREGDLRNGRGAAAIADCKTGRLDQGLSLHPCPPPVKPRTIESAFASSMLR